MLTLTNRIDMRPGAVPLVIHLGQYDSDFSLVFELYSSAGNFTVESGTTAMIRGTKTDGNAYDADATIDVSAKTVTVAGSEQMTAAKGRNVYELVLKKGTKVLSTANFILDVERAAMDADTIASESVLKELNAIIDSAATSTQAAADAASAADRAEDAADSVSSASTQIATNTADIADLKTDLKKKSGLTEDAKVALLDCFEHVAWINEHGQDYYDALYDALYPDSGLVRITATFTQGSTVIYPSTPLNDLKAYLTVTGYYNDGSSDSITDYALSGTLTVGTSTVTVTAGGKTATFDVVVTASYWDYEWYASSKTLPDGMVCHAYDFESVPNAMYVESGHMDLNYIGGLEIEVEGRFYAKRKQTSAKEYTGNNPQIIITYSQPSQGQYRGVKLISNSSLNANSNSYGLYAVGVNGVNTLLDIRSSESHVINLKAVNGSYSLKVDNTDVTLQANDNTSQYFGETGIIGIASEGSVIEYCGELKSIKYKKYSA